jgi:hypothetical protein
LSRKTAPKKSKKLKILYKIYIKILRYCRKRLGPPLTKLDNPFLRISVDESGKFVFYVPGIAKGSNLNYSKCFVEIFFAQQDCLSFNWFITIKYKIIKTYSIQE